MKAWKYITLLGGIAGLVGFFLPFVAFASADHSITGTVSAYQIVRGIDSVNELMSGVAPALLPSEQATAWAGNFNTQITDYRGAIVGFFIPAVLLALLGALAGVRRRMGRLAGLFALLFGAGNVAVWILFKTISDEQSSRDVVTTMGIGVHLVLAAGCAAVLAGLGAMLSPDRGTAP